MKNKTPGEKGKINVFNVVMKKVEDLLPYARNMKLHPPWQVKKIAMSIEQYGFIVPLVVDGKGEIIAGHGRLLAAKELNMEIVPCICVDHLTPEQVRAFRIADNKVSESEWDAELLEEEMKSLFAEKFNLDFTGFDTEELSDILSNVIVIEDQSEPKSNLQWNECPKCGYKWKLNQCLISI